MIDFPTLSYILQIFKSLPPLIYLRPAKGIPLSGGALAQYHSGSTIPHGQMSHGSGSTKQIKSYKFSDQNLVDTQTR